MAHHPDYTADREFRKLLTRRQDIDLSVAALELARDADPGVDFDGTLRWIAERGRELGGPVARSRTEIDALSEVSRCLAGRWGIFGEEAAYSRAESSYLHRVIATRRGIPISLSLLYMAVAREVGLELQGVASPLHYLARYESAGGPLFVDAYFGGRVLDLPRCVAWLHELTKLPEQDIETSLRPASPRTTVVRMLNNLKELHVRQENWRAALMVQHRLAALQPGCYEQRKDLALLAVRASRPGEAIDLLQSCLASCPSDERELLEEHLGRARSQLARWN